MTMQIGIGLSTNRDHLSAAKEALIEAGRSMPVNKISLAMAFSSPEYAHQSVIKTISGLLPESTPILGCTTMGLLANDNIATHGIMIVLVCLPQDAFLNAALVQDTKAKESVDAGKELADKLAYGFQGVRRDLSIILSDGLNQDYHGLISGLREKLGWSFPIIGALASAKPSSGKTHIYFNDNIHNNATCGFLLGGKIYFGFGIKHGWKPLGKPHHVTKVSGNVIYEINNLPAVKLYEQYLDKDEKELKKELHKISVFYPIGVYIPGEEEYLLRSIINIGENGSLVCHGDIHQDARIRLMIGTKESCVQAAQQAAEDAKTALGGHKISLVMLFDSASRHELLGRHTTQELGAIRKTLGQDVPLAGIYTDGEQAPLRAVNYLGKTYFHNQTIAIVAIAN